MEPNRYSAYFIGKKRLFKVLRKFSTVSKEFLEDGASYLSRIMWEITEGVNSLLYYYKMIWKSRSFDHGYCLNLYIHSLKRLRNTIKNSKIVLYQNNELSKLTMIITLLEFYNKEKNYKKYNADLNKLLKKYGLNKTDLDMVFENQSENTRYLTLKFKYEEKLNVNESNKFKSELVSLFIKNERIRYRAYRFGMYLLGKYESEF